MLAYAMLDLGSAVSLAGLGADTDELWTDGDTVYNAEGKLVPKMGIPKGDGPERQAWDARYRLAIERAFGTALTPLRVPIDPAVTVNNNPVKKPERYQMYQRMIDAGDRLPPLIVKPNGKNANGENMYLVMDGNHRWFAAQSRGVPELDALLVGSSLSAFGGLWRR